MPLQMDSTVLYSEGRDGGPVTSADLAIRSPYNTYLNKGLTPTPICFPSEAVPAGRPRPSARVVAVLRGGAAGRHRGLRRHLRRAAGQRGAGPAAGRGLTDGERTPAWSPRSVTTPGCRPPPPWSGSSATRWPTRSRRCCTTPPSPSWASTGCRWGSGSRRAGRPTRSSGPGRSGVRGLSVTMPHKDEVARLVARLLAPGRPARGGQLRGRRRGRPGGVRTPTVPAWWPPSGRRDGFDPGGPPLPGGGGRWARPGRWSPPWPTPGRPRWWWSTAPPERAGRPLWPWPVRSGGSGSPRTPRPVTWWSTPRPVGMAGAVRCRRGPAVALDPALLHAGQVVVDLIYHPSETPWMAAARARGATVVERARHAGPPGGAAARRLDRARASGRGHVARRCRPLTLSTRRVRPGRGPGGASNLSGQSPLVNYAPATVAARPRIRTLSARFDLVLVGCSVLLGLIGVVTVYTATKGKLALAGEDPRYFLKRQAVFLVIGVRGHGGHGPLRLPAPRTAQHRALHRHPGGPGGRAGHTGPAGGPALVPPRSHPAAAVRVRHRGPDHRHRHLLLPTTRGPRVPGPGPDGADGRAAHPVGLQAARPGHGHRHVGHPAGHAGRGRHARALPPRC